MSSSNTPLIKKQFSDYDYYFILKSLQHNLLLMKNRFSSSKIRNHKENIKTINIILKKFENILDENYYDRIIYPKKIIPIKNDYDKMTYLVLLDLKNLMIQSDIDELFLLISKNLRRWWD